MHSHQHADDTKARAATRPTGNTTPPATGDNVLASVQVDLDVKLCFDCTTLSLTARELRSQGAHGQAAQSWPLHADLSLKQHDHGGVGTLELHRRQADGSTTLLHLWQIGRAHV